TSPLPAVTTRARWLYGFGAAAYGVKDNGFSYFLMIYYSQVLGLPASLAGLAIMIALIFDAISDPLVGYWSDNTHSRWGRRHPFMYSAALPLGVCYYLLWVPPLAYLSDFGLFVYLTVAAILIRFLITLYEIPSTSIVAELTEDYDERTRLLSLRYLFGWYGGLAMAVLAWGVFLRDTPEYPNGVLNPTGYHAYGLVGSVVMVASILGSSIGLHSFIPHLKAPPRRKSHGLVQIARDLRVTLSNRNFLALFVAGLFAAVGAGVSTNFNAYISNYFWGFNSADIRWINVSLFLSASLAAIMAPLITRRWDKKASALGLYGIAIVYGALPVILRLLGWFPGNDSPYLLPIMIFHAITDVSLIVMFGIVQSSMLADIVEHSEMSTGRREEGLFFAARTFAAKATSGIGTLLAGITLDLIQFPRAARPGEVPEDVLFNLGLIYGPLLMVFYFMALVSISFYRITRTGHNDRVELLRERAQAPGPASSGREL
ncbi:MAG: MFS transporter, partial [Myxococcota bacterium]